MKLYQSHKLQPGNIIREQDPLKQGLKPEIHEEHIKTFSIREQDPLKQGLKLASFLSSMVITFIREQDPLKQGLKR